MVIDNKINVRQAVIDEAKNWLGARWQHGARVRYKAVDCGQLLLDVYQQCGMIAPAVIEHYPRQWALHRDDERYLDAIRAHAVLVDAPKPADIVVFKVGRAYSHGAIVLAWPRIIHAHVDEGVVYARADMGKLGEAKRLFFDVITTG